MYSRYHSASERPIRLPEHYNGCAFSTEPSDEKHAATKPQSLRQMEIGRPSALPPLEKNEPPEQTPARYAEDALETQEVSAPLSHSLLPGLFWGHGRMHSLLRGIGFEELLLLGLIVLLADNEESSDIVLWLILLLFCG